jgi:glutamate--cysteine ligase
VIRTGERPLHAQRERDVEYVEVRCMDLDPFVDIGIEADTTRLLDLFLLHCLLAPSPEDTPDEIAALGRNQYRTAAQGREPGLRLERREGAGTREVVLVEWAQEFLEALAQIAVALDGVHGGDAYRMALRGAHRALAEPATLPSARLLAEMRERFDGSNTGFIRAWSEAARARLLSMPWRAERKAAFAAMVRESLLQQQAIEAADTLDFETRRRAYLDPRTLVA